ncbi:MAG: META domain-containing protein [Gemmatimonadota bacterium]
MTLPAACRSGPEIPVGDVPELHVAPAGGPATEAVVPLELVDTSWRLVRIDERGLDPDLPDVTLTFETDRVSGSGGCNWYTGWLEEADGGLTISHLAVTRRSCVHPRIMDREARYLAALELVSNYRLTHGKLALIYQTTGEEARLVFEPSGGS